MRDLTASMVARICSIFCAVLATFLLLPNLATGMTDIYQLSSTTGAPTNMSGSTLIFGSYTSNRSSGLRNIGFDFYFDGKKYTQFNVTPSGLLSFASNPYTTYYPYYFPNSSTMRNSYPCIAGYWGRYFYTSSSGRVHSKVTGTAPNRVLTVEWYRVGRFGSFGGTNHSGTWQVRLHESSNRIEVLYVDMYRTYSSSTSYSAAIGIAASSTRYINVYGNRFPSEIYTYPRGGYYTYYRLYYDPISNGTMYVYNPCEKELTIEGDIAAGGTADMEEGDVLLQGKETQRGNTDTYNPFSIANPSNGCGPVSYYAVVSGPSAGDYSVTPGTLNIGQTVYPDINFTPGAIGDRPATIEFRLSNGARLIYDVNATGTTRMNWIGHVSEGGVGSMPSGSDLLSNIDVNRGDSRDLEPFTLDNINPNPGQFDADIEITLDDPLDEYELDLPGGTVTGGATQQTASIAIGYGGSIRPVITFSPHANGSEYGTGPQEAFLTVNADGEIRKYTLKGFSVAPALEMYIGGTRVITSDRNFYRNTVSCVGEFAVAHELVLENINRADVVIESFDSYKMDSRVQQGAPKYPMLLDSWGQPVVSHDYVVAKGQGIAPAVDNDLEQFPITLKPGEKRTYWLTYVAQRPDRRYARTFIRTNSVNFFGPDMTNFIPGQPSEPDVEGLMTLEFFGRGIGSHLAKDADGMLNGFALTFDPVKVGESIVGETTVHNTGECALRIDQDALQPTTGDVAEFELIEVLNGIPVDGGDYLLAPGTSGVIKARFTPSRSGSRRASVMLRTNDSTIFTDGVAERGIYYLDMFGEGKAELRARDLRLPPAVIDGPSSMDYVHVENASAELIEITSLNLTGPNSDVITESTTMPWPALPIRLEPETGIDLAIQFEPAPGSAPGPRQATLEIGYGSETVIATIVGEAGTRTMEASPMALFEGMNVPVGSVRRQTVILTNTGTFPVEIMQLSLEGASADHYTHTFPNRMVIDPGGFEFIEVTYAPTASGPSDATLVIANNGTDGDREVVLSGMAATTIGNGEESTGTISRGGVAPSGRTVSIAGYALNRPTPNPVHESVTVSYTIPTDGELELSLYDLSGTRVSTVIDGVRESGAHESRLDVSSLPSGVYMLRLQHGDQTLTRSITVVK